MRSCKRWAREAALTFLLVALGTRASEPPADLAELQKRAAEVAQRLAELSARANALGSRREQLEAQLAVASLEVRKAEMELKVVEGELVQAQDKLGELQRRAAAKQQDVRLRVGTLAAVRKTLEPYLLAALWADPRGFVEKITLLVAVVAYQKKQLDEVSSLVVQQNQALAWLSQKQEEVRQRLRELAAARRRLEATRQQVLAEMARLESERRAQALALSDLEEAQTRLERLWGRVTGERNALPAGIRLLKGGLPWPVAEGRVVRGFGRFRDSRYATVVVHPGWDLAVAPGAEVNAVAAGRVVYAQFFKSFGNLVILAHGEDVYTLYGRLATMFVSSGQRVAMGETLGLAGPGGPDGNLYFEVRNGRTAQDPAAWLRPKGKP
ncbi:MAG: murein hydrolase activator EnvC family protein [Thermoanaerobaculum sp.]